MAVVNGKRGARLGALLAITFIGLAAAGCGRSSTSAAPASGSRSSGAAKATGTADVAYAASLQFLNEKIVGPAFATATGQKYSGRSGPSDGLSAEIAAGEISPNAFESVGGSSIEKLEPKFTKWYVQFATTSIVVAYNPKSKYAGQFAAISSGRKPVSDLFSLFSKPGFKLGRTDPNTDPQGRAFIYMLELAQAKYHLRKDAVTKILGGPLASTTSPEIFAEASLESTLQAGQLDAASAYLSQAIQLHLHCTTLPADINLGSAADKANYAKASITITDKTGSVKKTGSPLVIDITTIGKPTKPGIAFVQYVLSPAGLALHKQGGYTLLTPMAFGDTSAIPASVHSELGG
jgi:molybdate/tungstate transport system substrate-binding protein